MALLVYCARKNRPRCSLTGGFLCSFNTITPKSPHSKPFPIPFASVLGVKNRAEVNKSTIDGYIGINEGIFLAGIADSEYNEGSLFFIRKKIGEEFNTLRLDSGTTYDYDSNSGGTFVARISTIPDGRHWYAWSLKLT